MHGPQYSNTGLQIYYIYCKYLILHRFIYFSFSIYAYHVCIIVMHQVRFLVGVNFLGNKPFLKKKNSDDSACRVFP